jgi:trimethylamine---corrinoid protein Co-methyltransferase
VAELHQIMASAVDDLYKYPIMCIGISPESPLYFPKDMVSVMRALIPAGIPTT